MDIYIWIYQGRVADPGGVATEPDPTFKKNPGPGIDRHEKQPDPHPWLEVPFNTFYTSKALLRSSPAKAFLLIPW